MRFLAGTNRNELKKKIEKILLDEIKEHKIIPIDNSFIDELYKFNPEVILLDLYKIQKIHTQIINTITTAPSLRKTPLIVILKKRTDAILKKLCDYGVFDYLFDSFIKCELIMKIQKAKELVELKREFDKLLTRDPLTGAYNRSFLMERIREELNWCGIYKEPLTLAILDIDHFKKINDVYGHLSGDRVLIELIYLCLNILPNKVTVGRYGGEEFCLLMPSTDADEALEICEHLRKEVEKSDFHTFKGDKINITISIGYTTFLGDIVLYPDELIQKADIALYKAKQSGRNRVIFEGFELE